MNVKDLQKKLNNSSQDKRNEIIKFATEPYQQPSKSNINDVFMHLTNYAINKHNSNFDNDADFCKGSKRTISAILKLIETLGHDTSKIWKRISDLINKTVITIQPQIRKILKACFRNPTVNSGLKGNFITESGPVLGSQCFEVLGFDIFLDHKLKPWLLEVNHSPSFSCDSILDYQVKKELITDTLRLIQIDPLIIKKFNKDQKEKTKKRLFNSSKPIKVFDQEKEGMAFTSCNPTEKAKTSVKTAEICITEGNDVLSAFQHFDENRETSAPAAENTAYLKTENLGSEFYFNEFGISDMEMENDAFSALNVMAQQHDEASQRLLKDYHSNYSKVKLDELTEYENGRLGKFQRIFPPDDEGKLCHYLKLIETNEALFGETIASKARKDFIKKKNVIDMKKTQRLKNEKFKKIKPKKYRVRENDAVSNISNLKDSQKGKVAESSLTVNMDSQLKDSTSNLVEKRINKKIIPQVKASLKLNVESVNDRFMKSLLVEKQYSVDELSSYEERKNYFLSSNNIEQKSFKYQNKFKKTKEKSLEEIFSRYISKTSLSNIAGDLSVENINSGTTAYYKNDPQQGYKNHINIKYSQENIKVNDLQSILKVGGNFSISKNALFPSTIPKPLLALKKNYNVCLGVGTFYISDPLYKSRSVSTLLVMTFGGKKIRGIAYISYALRLLKRLQNTSVEDLSCSLGLFNPLAYGIVVGLFFTSGYFNLFLKQKNKKSKGDDNSLLNSIVGGEEDFVDITKSMTSEDFIKNEKKLKNRQDVVKNENDVILKMNNDNRLFKESGNPTLNFFNHTTPGSNFIGRFGLMLKNDEFFFAFGNQYDQRDVERVEDVLASTSMIEEGRLTELS
ncbi:Tubulin polyglutamylase ttll6 [Clydaea vesicula]|uniref:Tubulin polyglutamylase ttll6 n=1 Tax=Clydaea vesicula TaxID=447962 RepID=A0AAD5Y1D2_9FUNG|nr:Tubulin polyglutamylase ttll6 [Clydaea vesicula]